MSFSEHPHLIPPINFACVAPGVYRSGYPMPANFPFLEMRGIRTVLWLAPESYSPANLAWMQSAGIRLIQIGVQGSKEPFIELPPARIAECLLVLADQRNHPVLVHCNKGLHRTGIVIGCFRKLMNWSLSSIYGEYRIFSDQKARFYDTQFIEMFDKDSVPIDPKHAPKYIMLKKK